MNYRNIISEMIHKQLKEETVAAKDATAAANLKLKLIESLKIIDSSIKLIDKELSTYNAPALVYSFKESIYTYLKTKNLNQAINKLEDYYK